MIQSLGFLTISFSHVASLPLRAAVICLFILRFWDKIVYFLENFQLYTWKVVAAGRQQRQARESGRQPLFLQVSIPKPFLNQPGDQDIAFSFTFQWVLIPTFLVTFRCIRHLVSTCFFCLMAMIWQIYNHFKQLKCESLSLNFVLTLGLIREQKQTLSKSSWIQISRFLRLAASCPVTITEFAKTDDNIDEGFYILS